MEIIGIDISKKELSVALLIEQHKLKYKIFENNKKGFTALKEWLEKIGIIKAKVCMEATGRYGEGIADFLYGWGHEVSVVNPACIKAFSQSKLARHKTDKSDALLIAEYASKYELRLYIPQDALHKELKDLYRCSQNLKAEFHKIGNYLENKEYLPASVISIWESLQQELESKVKDVEKKLVLLIAQSEELSLHYQNLQSIPGIGQTTAVAILAELPDISTFKSARQMAAYMGLTPKHATSGSSVRGRSKLSKMGSSRFRKALYFPAVSVITHNSIFKAFHKKLKLKTKHNMTIIVAVMRKLLHIIFGVLKHKTTFKAELHY